jgi:hypothetical protein
MYIAALADGDNLLLLWINIVGFRIPSILLVRQFFHLLFLRKH